MSGNETPAVIMGQDLKAVQPLILKAMDKGRVNVFNIQMMTSSNSGNSQDNSTTTLMVEGDKTPSLPAPSDEVLRNTLDVATSDNLLDTVSQLMDALPSPKLANLIKLALHSTMNKCSHTAKAGDFLSIGRGAMKYQLDKYKLSGKR